MLFAMTFGTLVREHSPLSLGGGINRFEASGFSGFFVSFAGRFGAGRFGANPVALGPSKPVSHFNHTGASVVGDILELVPEGKAASGGINAQFSTEVLISAQRSRTTIAGRRIQMSAAGGPWPIG